MAPTALGTVNQDVGLEPRRARGPCDPFLGLVNGLASSRTEFRSNWVQILSNHGLGLQLGMCGVVINAPIKLSTPIHHHGQTATCRLGVITNAAPPQPKQLGAS